MKELPQTELLYQEAAKRILILDGAMGTMFRTQELSEKDFRKGPFADAKKDLFSVKDILNLTKPSAPEAIHDAYLAAGADIIETNTFNANAVALEEFGLARFAYDINKAGAQVARACANKFAAKDGRPRFVAGSMGPTGRTASLSPDPDDPAARNITFDELREAYYFASLGLLDGGADLILIETVFDTLNAKAAVMGVSQAAKARGVSVPVMLSGTVSDASGRMLAGQCPQAFLQSLAHTGGLFSIGFNCALGAAEMQPHIRELSERTTVFTSAYPNAGLPDAEGNYSQTPEKMAEILRSFAEEGIVNIVGGCCGTSPAHIEAIAEAVKGMPPRKAPPVKKYLRLSGLDVLELPKTGSFTDIGERANVAGSKKFLNLIREKKYDEALQIVRTQIAKGAKIIDVNMDDSLLDAEKEMTNFLRLAVSEPDIAKVPFMIDSSRWEVIEAGLKCVQGKCVVNSLSLKEGEEAFLKKASLVRSYGAALLVLACDEKGQADTVARRVEVCRRAYSLLTEKLCFPGEDIIFDPNVFAIGTGLAEHADYAKDFFEAVRQIHEGMPLANISGGISNVSFAFRGNNAVREAIHSVFLHHAVKNGLNMGIVNPAGLVPYEKLPEELREAAEAVVLNLAPDAPEKLIEIGEKFRREPSAKGASPASKGKEERGKLPLEERIADFLAKGQDQFVESDMKEALEKYSDPVEIIEGPLMEGMKKIGVLFGEGRMFLPQDNKSARVMKKAVSVLMPAIEAKKSAGNTVSAGKIVIATVNGDVHDIGKNIAGLVLQCNNYTVIDLGVMCPCGKIVDAAEKEKADMIILSGLIFPSLNEMCLVAKEMEKRGMTIPLLVAGAATSKVHTALKIAPLYSGVVAHVQDASQDAVFAGLLINGSGEAKDQFVKELREEYASIRAAHGEKTESAPSFPSLAEARSRKVLPDYAKSPAPNVSGIFEFSPAVSALVPFVKWEELSSLWKTKGGEAEKDLLSDAKALLPELEKSLSCRAAAAILPAYSREDDIFVTLPEGEKICLPMLRNQKNSYCLADYIAPEGLGPENGQDHIGVFALSCGFGLEELRKRLEEKGDSYSSLLASFLANLLAEAFAEFLHRKVREKLWGWGNAYEGIRPAPGYPACPDHTLKEEIFHILDAQRRIGLHLTSSFMMDPESSVCGFYFAHPDARYMAVGEIGDDQKKDYALRRGRKEEELLPFIAFAGK